MTRRGATLQAAYFDGIYADDPDPWRFETSAYEAEKYAATLAALPGTRYAAALEIGCSIGVLTRALAERCDALLALDIAPAALTRARARCADRRNVSFAQMAVPGDWPEGRFDLVLLSEVVYYLDPADVGRLADRLRDAMRPEGDIVLVHWTGLTDYPLSGDEAAERLIREVRDFARVLTASRSDQYRIDVLRVD